ncbi:MULTISPECIES: ADP-ribosylglycohydrolase family protein [Faecalicoccus]|uniref:ADP-ribosylglycohydrolase family protein n=1 Tax=Faecalicoccus pleomorphus TaxID=1323 RepID=A0AAW6CP02_9FIRM|nr:MULTISPECIES: ADP-ribosylglycohydrolase family protein [Faecalicoccus]MDB7979300.1 ADP-ribosylglycohydrolase family protein [Faecalicoccus pleomorphus]MDB7981568.1 ADP-ribosylglycohydrolase family protein [Faecalicoccus pleomorphus]MDY5232308.1 ADP-ribosylglycohydrolase family protein [Faecalicoccus sp.]
MNKFEEKVLGVLGSVAYGDALGSATENLPFDQIRGWFKGPIKNFQIPGDTAFALGNKAGQVTDDFSQVYFILEEVLKSKTKLTEEVLIKAMIEWSNHHEYFDRFAGPTTRGAIAMYKDPHKEMKALPGAVVVDYASKATNGAAMKIAPAAILNPCNIESTIQDAILMAKVTHDNSLAMSGACATAVACTTGFLENTSIQQSLYAGLYGAIRGEEIAKEKYRWVAGASVVERIKLAFQIALEYKNNKEEGLKKLYDVIGSGLHISEAVPCAFGIVAMNESNPMQAIVDAANIGYDTDTIAAITGTIVGPHIDINDDEFKSHLSQIETVNNMDLRRLAQQITKLR